MKKKHPILCTCLNQSPVWLTAGINCTITGCSPPALGPLGKVWRTCGVIVTNVPLNTYHWAVTTTKAVRSLTLLTGSRCHLYPNAPQVNDDLFVSGQGREGFPRLLVLINMHDAGRRNVCVCVCDNHVCLPSCNFVHDNHRLCVCKHNIRDANTHFFLGFFFFLSVA